MAITITGTQVNFPSGVMQGYYTGSSSTNTSFPVGSMLICQTAGGYPVNSTVPSVSYSVYNSFSYCNNESGQIALAGTWRNNYSSTTPNCCNSTTFCLIQRSA